MTDTRTPRPTDLVALVMFDEDVRENLAITRDHIGMPNDAPRPLAAAIEQWLHLGRRTWISVAGREIRGIATARELASRSAWEIDTLVDAPEGGAEVVADLLRQAARAAREALATHVLLRTPADSLAAQTAPRAGFRRVVEERLWIGHLPPSASSTHHAGQIREAGSDDPAARFQVYCRALPVAAREALAMTFEEWQAVQSLRWLDRGGALLVEEADGRARGVAQTVSRGQFTLELEPGHLHAGLGLLEAVGQRSPGAPDHFGLLATGSAAEEAARLAGLEPAAEYQLFCLRVSRPVRDEAFARAGIAITGG